MYYGCGQVMDDTAERLLDHSTGHQVIEPVKVHPGQHTLLIFLKKLCSDYILWTNSCIDDHNDLHFTGG